MSTKPLIFTGRLRSAIYRELRQSGAWKGSRLGVKIRIRLLKQKTIAGAIEWEARLLQPAGFEWKQGNAEDVFAATRQIEEAAAAAKRRTN
jgi:hypothetical protein